ncbi:MAG: calcium/sodium antiporter [Proteobacteria bacterium]|nr:calcium/sodium antiporter [Pseudomonadota bacterium]MCH8178038.1 calcium/sodium antiporter [Pseudomonadota bacterium]
MLISFGAVAAGLVVLVWSANHFVEGASALAKHLGVSSLIIGITIIGFGTSAPEILVSVISVLEETPDIAIGNALGSNIANIGLILGITALITPVPIAKEILSREFPLLLIATTVMIWCLYDGALNRFDGGLLLVVLAAMLWFLVKSHRLKAEQGEDDVPIAEIPGGMSFKAACSWIVLGLIFLVGSSKLLVWGATNIAHAFGISELIIGLTIVALGTSLPELAASLASLKKQEPDLAIGNVIGSNLFNSLAVIGIPSVITSFRVDASAITRDLPVVVGLTILLYAMARFPLSSSLQLSRTKGSCLIACFVIYQLYLYYSVTTGNS